MELADPKTIASLVSSRNPIQTPDARKTGTIKRSQSMRHTCTCGTCNTCVDNAKWERIYREKFEDTAYYGHRPVPVGSSLSWLSVQR